MDDMKNDSKTDIFEFTDPKTGKKFKLGFQFPKPTGLVPAGAFPIKQIGMNNASNNSYSKALNSAITNSQIT